MAALVGVTNGVDTLEGSIGNHPLRIVGPIKRLSRCMVPRTCNQSYRNPPNTDSAFAFRHFQLLLGGQPAAKCPNRPSWPVPSPSVDASDPPLWLIHGDVDPQMPPQQSKELETAYQKADRPVKLDVVSGGKHGGDEFYTHERLDRIPFNLKSWTRFHPTPRRCGCLFAGSSSTYWNDMPNEIAKVISGRGRLGAAASR